jgi:hypothetical protein
MLGTCTSGRLSSVALAAKSGEVADTGTACKGRGADKDGSSFLPDPEEDASDIGPMLEEVANSSQAAFDPVDSRAATVEALCSSGERSSESKVQRISSILSAMSIFQFHRSHLLRNFQLHPLGRRESTKFARSSQEKTISAQ